MEKVSVDVTMTSLLKINTKIDPQGVILILGDPPTNRLITMIDVQIIVIGVQMIVIDVQRIVVGVQMIVVGVQRIVIGIQMIVVGVQRIVIGIQMIVIGVQRIVVGVQTIMCPCILSKPVMEGVDLLVVNVPLIQEEGEEEEEEEVFLSHIQNSLH